MGASGLGQLLVDEGLIQEFDRRTIRRTSGNQACAFAKGILALGLFDDEQLACFLTEFTKFDRVSKEFSEIVDLDTFSSIDPNLIMRLEIVPIMVSGRYLTVAIADPLDHSTINQLAFFTGYKIRPMIATQEQIIETIQKMIPSFQPSPTPLQRFLMNHADAAAYSRRLQDMSDPDINFDTPQSSKPVNFASPRTDDNEFEELSLDDAYGADYFEPEEEAELDLSSLNNIDGDITTDLELEDDPISDDSGLSSDEDQQFSPEDLDDEAESEAVTPASVALDSEESGEEQEPVAGPNDDDDDDSADEIDFGDDDPTQQADETGDTDETDDAAADPELEQAAMQAGRSDNELNDAMEPAAQSDADDVLNEELLDPSELDADSDMGEDSDEQAVAGDDLLDEFDSSTEMPEAEPAAAAPPSLEGLRAVADEAIAGLNRAMISLAVASSREDVCEVFCRAVGKTIDSGAILKDDGGAIATVCVWSEEGQNLRWDEGEVDETTVLALSQLEPDSWTSQTVGGLNLSSSAEAEVYVTQLQGHRVYLAGFTAQDLDPSIRRHAGRMLRAIAKKL